MTTKDSMKKFKDWCDQYTDPRNFSDEMSHMVSRMLLFSLWDFKDKENEKLENALRESVKIQSHYASLLNTYDGGKRIVFSDAEEWMERLDKLKNGGIK